ncbi:MAG: hypothetical protein U0235_04405 [Polyangiaceae bacterium]
MQASCCASTKACFVDSPECAALYACINQCPSRGLGAGSGTGAGGGDGGGGGGGGDGGGGGGGEGGAGAIDAGDASVDAGGDAGHDPCVDACNAAHPAQAGTAREYIRCYAGACRTQCQ